MRKNLLMFIMILVLAVSFTACTEKDEPQPVSVDVEDAEEEVTEAVEEEIEAEVKEAVMYQYVEGETSGVIITGADASYAEEMGMMTSTSMFADITDASSEDITARVETLDGEEVVYIESTESDEDIGEALVKMWYSVKYAMPLKYEFIMGQVSMVQYTITEITDNVNFDESTFVPPASVNFQEVDMASMLMDW